MGENSSCERSMERININSADFTVDDPQTGLPKQIKVMPMSIQPTRKAEKLLFLAWKGSNNNSSNNQLTKATIYRAIDVIWKVYTFFFYGKVYVSLWAENVCACVRVCVAVLVRVLGDKCNAFLEWCACTHPVATPLANPSTARRRKPREQRREQARERESQSFYECVQSNFMS